MGRCGRRGGRRRGDGRMGSVRTRARHHGSRTSAHLGSIGSGVRRQSVLGSRAQERASGICTDRAALQHGDAHRIVATGQTGTIPAQTLQERRCRLSWKPRLGGSTQQTAGRQRKSGCRTRESQTQRNGRSVLGQQRMNRTKPKNRKDALEVRACHFAPSFPILETVASGSPFAAPGERNNHSSWHDVSSATGSKAKRCPVTWNCASERPGVSTIILERG
mmetsp:Transcript_1697/g.10436  ORF Transcript_1697/g.10436 Transcript_1697/m.10436 type:complete len:220 (-) Transcript_1697:1131-1790(-)